MILSNGWSPPWLTFAKKLTFVFRNLGNAWSNILSKLINGSPTYRMASCPQVGTDSDNRGLLGAPPSHPTLTAATSSASPATAQPHVPPTMRRSSDISFRLHFPEFTPTNPRYWIRKCEQYFDVHDIEEHCKVKLARLHQNEEGDTWLSNELLHHNALTWPQFVNRLCDRFGVQDFETVIAEFNHLKQTGSVADNIKRFEELQGHVLRAHVTLSDKYFISCFLGGLTDPLQPLVRAHTPLTIQEAMAKAKLHKAALKSLAKHQFRSSPSPLSFRRSENPTGSTSCQEGSHMLPLRRPLGSWTLLQTSSAW
ncbi:hypothetical protein EJ110_NYTH35531 [Nymphaea thermarum]|nr:hypothetical protein EJ110_NYTH35531 [Nymphaea thermarum]